MKTRNIILTAVAIFGLAMISTSAVQAQDQNQTQVQEKVQSQDKIQEKAQTQTKIESKAQDQTQAKVREEVAAKAQAKVEAKIQSQTMAKSASGVCDGTGRNFVDLNGDGINDNAPDHDGDGIPNGLDEDWVKHAQDGDGYQIRQMSSGDRDLSTLAQHRMMTKAQLFTRLQAFNGNVFRYKINAAGSTSGSGTGVCDGTGGNGTGTGVCDGTGPKGNQKGGGN